MEVIALFGVLEFSNSAVWETYLPHYTAIALLQK